MLHNEVVHVFENAFTEASYKDVKEEPELQVLNGEVFHYKSAIKDDEARSDIRVRGFWRRLRHAFFDVTAFSPFARSYKSKSLASVFRQHEKRKNREYGERIRQVEQGDFTPLVFATTGGMGPQATIVLKKLATRISERQNKPRTMVMAWLRCRLSFALLRTSLILLRGSRPYRPIRNEYAIELAVSEARMEVCR